MKTLFLACFATLTLNATTLVSQESLPMNDWSNAVVTECKELNKGKVNYLPRLSFDEKTLYFVSDCSGGVGKHDIWYAPIHADGTFGEMKNPSVLNSEYSEGGVAYTNDRKIVAFVACPPKSSCKIFIIRRKDGKPDEQLDIILAGEAVNGKPDVWVSQPFFDTKNNLYFTRSTYDSFLSTSNFRNLDIWYAPYDSVTKTWNSAKKIEDVSGQRSEMTPFLSSDDTYLFFASTGFSNNQGEHDLFISERSGKDKWSKPINIGKPINTSADELGGAITKNGKTLYFSRKQGDKILLMKAVRK